MLDRKDAAGRIRWLRGAGVACLIAVPQKTHSSIMMSRLLKPLVLGGVAVAAVLVQAALPPRGGSPAAADWPAFRGATNGDAPALPVADASKIKLTRNWKVPTPTGFSSF